MRTKTAAGSALAATAAVVAASYADAGASNALVWAVVTVLVLLFAIGWPRMMDLPAASSASVLVALAGWAAATVASASSMPEPMKWMAACAAVGVIAVFVAQLMRGTGERQRLESTVTGAGGIVVAVFGSGWVAVDRLAPNASNSSMMVVSGLSIAAAVLAGTIRWPDRVTAPLGLLVAALVGGVGSVIGTDIPIFAGVAVGAVVGAVVVGCRVLMVAERGARGTLAAIAAGVAPVLAAGALAYYVERLLLR
ncbi:hypothetical protein [Arthrobacter sp. KK5.5]|uniref:hypothetical protein n=1 Tax=Arthrobacter sp. KK5.5 TaxID=3373084 RepID=UPI003EE5EFA1